jgi:hypothetical protein
MRFEVFEAMQLFVSESSRLNSVEFHNLRCSFKQNITCKILQSTAATSDPCLLDYIKMTVQGTHVYFPRPGTHKSLSRRKACC